MSALTGKNIDVVVTGGMGGRAVQKLNEGGIKTYRAIPGTVADIINKFTKSGLDEITVQNACAQHGCH
jgi:predicted Fe-Mo cluster-binding NifX family protein